MRNFELFQDYRFDNFVLNHGLLWQQISDSLLTCAADCVNDRPCISFNFHQGKRQCRAYETLMLTADAGTSKEDWTYFYITRGNCPFPYAYSRTFNYCLGYEGHSDKEDGFSQCQGKGGRFLLIRTAEENRFASLLAYNFNHLSDPISRQMIVQGNFDFVDMTWKDDSGANLTFTQFREGQAIPESESALFIKHTNNPTNFMMTSRKGNKNPSIVVCII
ncbi:uncharacterized protein LOC133188000 [Saccostrea echinata]|uniref:uncharacterized protein LOC133188000 n=1 Tax=Saccostrea echinata TaxID=191078 RepID=UPI002A7ECEA9|nr:uncharacterized protein LOC133188000 [Saccostrea echinata]